MWTPLTGNNCNDNDSCTHSDKCKEDGLCEGTRIECSLPCQGCNGTSTCDVIKGCLWDSTTCGCFINGTCYYDGEKNPHNQCQYCDIFSTASHWTNYSKGFPCDDNNSCTRNDICSNGTCSGYNFTHECANHTVDTNPCVSGTRCDGSECLPVYHEANYSCYTSKDQCDYPDLTCEGGRAECRHCEGGNCTTVHLGNTPKRTSGVDLSIAAIFVYKSDASTLLSLKMASDGNEYFMITNNKEIKITFINFTVPCDNVTLDWQLAAATGNETVVAPQTVTTTSAGTVDVLLTNQSLTNGAIYVVNVLAKNVRNDISFLNSSLILVDTTPPLIGIIYDGNRPQPNQHEDITYQMNNRSIRAHWNSALIYDSESGLEEKYEMAVGTAPNGSNTHNFTEVQADSGNVTVSLQHNTTYYVTLRVYNRAGLFSIGSSNGVKVDITNPVTGTLAIVKDDNYTQLNFVNKSLTSRIRARLRGCNDPESGISKIQWTVCAESVTNASDSACNEDGYKEYLNCSYPEDCVIIVTLPTDERRILHNGSFLSGYSYNLRLIVTNGALRKSFITSTKFITDYSPPEAGKVLDGLSKGKDIDFQSANTSVDVNWSDFKDEESKLDYCQVAVRESNTTQDSAFKNVSVSRGSATMAGNTTVTNLTLATGKRYIVKIRCFNKAGLYTDAFSDGVLVDAFPPGTTKINDTRFEDVLNVDTVDRDYQASLTGIRTKWKRFSSLSELNFCYWSLKNQSKVVVFEKEIFPNVTSFSYSLLLVHNTTYYASVRCTSNAGLSSIGTSDGITPDDTHPIAGVVYDLCADSCSLLTDIDYSSNTTALAFRWDGFSDPDSGMEFYEWSWSSNPACFNNSGRLESSQKMNGSYWVHVLSCMFLNHNTLYRATVLGYNGAGLKVKSVSDGVLIDTTPPKKVLVKDGESPLADIDYHSSNSVISFTWPLIRDDESYIAILEVGLGSEPGDSNVVNMTTVVNETTSHTFSDLNLQQNDVYYAKVCATNTAGLQTCVHSDGVLIDLSGPVKGVVIHGTVKPGNNFQSENTKIAAHWYGFSDLESAVDYFEWAIGTSANGTDIMNYTDVGSNVTFSTDIQLDNGKKYFISVLCYNKAGLQIAASSNGVTVDVTSPVVPPAENVIVNIVEGRALNASWPGFTDTESPMWYYKWAIGTKKCGTQVQNYMNVGTKTKGSCMTNFVSGLRYYVAVAGKNRAGLISKVCTEGTLYDEIPPITGTVRDGNGNGDLAFQSTLSHLSANWDMFTDDHSKLKECHIGIGTTNSTDDFYSYEMVSINATSHVFSSLTMTSGAKYFVLVRCANELGLVSVQSSNGIVIDATPPADGTVTTPRYQYSLEVIVARWNNFTDPESGIDSYWWSISRTAPLPKQEIQPFFDVKLDTAATAENLTLQTNGMYFVYVKAFNKAHLYSVKSSSGLMIDVSPPSGGYVLDGMSQIDIDWKYEMTGIGAHWYNFTDTQSRIESYRWSVGTDKDGCQVLPFTSVALRTSAFCQNCSFTANVKYLVTVEASNGAGLKSTATSDGFRIDLTRPKAGFITGLKWSTNNLLTVNWTGGYDHQSGPPQCQLFLTAPKQWAIQLSLQSAVRQTINVSTNGYSYSKNVEVYANCTNRASLTSTSPFVSIDGTPPAAGMIELLHYDNTSFTVQFSEFRDPESIVDSIELRQGGNRSSDSTVLSPYEGFVYTHSVHSGSLYGTTQIVSARALSTAGLVSNWIEKAFHLPAPTESLSPSDCCNIEMTYTVAVIKISWHWRNGLNNESYALGYQYYFSIGTVPGGNQILNYTSTGSARNAVCTSCLLLQGERYYVSLRSSLDSFITYTNHQSEGFLIDLTPPIAGDVLDGLTADRSYYTVNESFSAKWKGFTDPDSPVESCKICVIESSSSNVIWSEEKSSNGTGAITIQLTTWIHSYLYKTKVSCRNEIGLVAEALSDGFVVDETPPNGGVVSLILGTTSNELVNVSGLWSDFVDNESGISTYEWMIVKSGAHPNGSMNAAGKDTSFSALVNLTTATKYELLINATNSVGLETLKRSVEVVYDATAPKGSYVQDGAGASDLDYQFSTVGISATWGKMTDEETGIDDCAWYVGTRPGGAELLSPESIGLRMNASCLHCVLTPGMTYYTSVMCYNAAGLQTIASSNGILVDPTRPIPGRVYDGKGKRDRNFQGDSSYIDCSWDDFSDPDSGIVAYRSCLGTTKTVCNVKEKSEVTNSTEWRFVGVKLQHTWTYYCLVTGINAAGLSYTSTSDGVTVDMTSPKGGTVIDGKEVDIDCQYSNEVVAATWFDFYDSESGIVDYEWSIGTTHGQGDIQGFVSVGLNLTASNPNATLPVDTMIFVTVRAYNEAGRRTAVSSDGVLLSDPQNGSSERCVSLFVP